MGNAVQDDRFAPPQAHVDDVSSDQDGPQLAGRWERLAAAIIDGLAAAALLWVVGKVTGWDVWGTAAGFDYWSPQFRNILVGLASFLVLQAYLLVTRAQTIGKVALKLRITRTDGSKPSPGRILGLRYGVGVLFGIMPALAQIWGLLDALLIFRPSRKCLHDSIADTIVIKA